MFFGLSSVPHYMGFFIIIDLVTLVVCLRFKSTKLFGCSKHVDGAINFELRCGLTWPSCVLVNPQGLFSCASEGLAASALRTQWRGKIRD